MHAADGARPGNAAIDPVCGMSVDLDRSPFALEHEGRRFAFCSAGCRERFRVDPGRYLGHVEEEARESPARAGAEPAGALDRIFTCPMHPEVRQVGPGSCPKCGMALEPLLPSAADEEDRKSVV